MAPFPNFALNFFCLQANMHVIVYLPPCPSVFFFSLTLSLLTSFSHKKASQNLLKMLLKVEEGPGMVQALLVSLLMGSLLALSGAMQREE